MNTEHPHPARARWVAWHVLSNGVGTSTDAATKPAGKRGGRE